MAGQIEPLAFVEVRRVGSLRAYTCLQLALCVRVRAPLQPTLDATALCQHRCLHAGARNVLCSQFHRLLRLGLYPSPLVLSYARIGLCGILPVCEFTRGLLETCEAELQSLSESRAGGASGAQESAGSVRRLRSLALLAVSTCRAVLSARPEREVRHA